MEQEKQHIVWHDDVIIKQLISYAIGCMMDGPLSPRQAGTSGKAIKIVPLQGAISPILGRLKIRRESYRMSAESRTFATVIGLAR